MVTSVGAYKGRLYAAVLYNPCNPLIKGTNGRFAPSRGIADWSAIFIIGLLDFSGRLFFVYIRRSSGLWLPREGLIKGSYLNGL